MFFAIEQFDEKEKLLFGEEEFGLEKESLRVDPEGNIAGTAHPFIGDPKRDRDFAESQVEMITEVHPSVNGVILELEQLQADSLKILKHLPGGPEMLWPFSNPPYLARPEDIPVAHYSGELKDKEVYREYLAEKYGKKKMLYSGIHYNFSYRSEVLEYDFHKKTAVGYTGTFQEYKDSIYLDLAGKLLKRCWLIVYLTAASPVFDGSYFDETEKGRSVCSPFASPRCSREGYWNDFIPVLDFSDAEKYAESIEKYVEDGSLRQPSELYYPLRLKPAGAYSMEKLRKGINHIELRMLDLNPYSSCGVDGRDLKFIAYLLHYLSFLPEEETNEEEQTAAVRNMKAGAELEEDCISIHIPGQKDQPLLSAALTVLENMEEKLAGFESVWPDLPEVMEYEKEKILHPEKRYARMVQKDYGSEYVEKVLKERFPEL